MVSFGLRCAMCSQRLKVPRDVARRVADGSTFVCCDLCAAAYRPFWLVEDVGRDARLIDIAGERVSEFDAEGTPRDHDG